jgi:LmbE family N-acetylglucosaminyl deacetylase
MEEMRKRGIAVPDFGEDEEIASLPRLDANCVIDVSDVFDRKIRAMLAHSSQITPDDAFMSMPEDIQRSFFGREFFYRAHPPVHGAGMLGDLLE